MFFTSSECILNTEVNVISAALGGKNTSVDAVRSLISFFTHLYFLGDEGSQMPHSFKSSSFSIPTQCGYCKVIMGSFSGNILSRLNFSRQYGD